MSFEILRRTAALASQVSSLSLLLAAGSLAATAETATSLDPELLAPDMLVIGSPSEERELSGSASVVDNSTLETSLVFTVDEALRKAGVFTRMEEGLGLRPNIGLRGLDPTRSRKVLLLEDGIPLAHSPYGDNSSYYHPQIDRFARVEVLKGAGQIAYGPHTVGGVINYATQSASETLTGALTLAGGDRGYSEVGIKVSDTFGDLGLVALFDRRAADGARENQDSTVQDLFLKAIYDAGEDRILTLRASWYDEASRMPYSGLTLAEFEANPRQNPFVNDRFDTHRLGASASWAAPVLGFDSVTTLYWSTFERDWWRQSSNSGQRPNDASDPACGGMANLSTTCGNEGRLRSYWVAGLEPRFSRRFLLGDVTHDIDFGVRWHAERQYRVQENGDTPNARQAGVGVNAGVRENDIRETEAVSAYVQNRIDLGTFALTPGVRIERIAYDRFNRLTGRGGSDTFTEVVPGLGLTWEASEGVNLFAGLHRGFSPPAVSDLIGSTGGSIDLDPERSWNWEAGVRAAPLAGVDLEATWFLLDFENQIIPASVAGGVGSTLTSAGETRSQGLDVEMSYRPESVGAYGRLAWVWLGDAEFVGRRNSNVSGFSSMSTTGNRLPYAPEHLVAATVGYRGTGDWTAELEWVRTTEVFTDDLNTVAVTPNGQRGEIAGSDILNLALRVPVSGLLPGMGLTETGQSKLDVFVAVKNLTDELYVVDRSRGTIPGDGRRVQAGLTARF